MTTANGHLAALQAHFLKILPRIELHARIQFRHLRCPGRRDDAVAETIAVSWQWFLRIAEAGKDVDDFVSALAAYAVRHVRSGRRVTGQERMKDALSPLAQQRHGFSVSKLPEPGALSDNPQAEALADNAVSPVPEQAAFRIDFAAWLQTHDGRNRQVIRELMLGERTLDVADRHYLSPGRISQMRRLFHQNWLHFHGEPAAAGV